MRYFDDFPVFRSTNLWNDTGSQSGSRRRSIYVVQTPRKVVERCLLMTTDPGDLVLDPTCGSGTTAYVAEQWGRRWITIDTSRVPLALARQRLLTATFPYYELQDDDRGPGSWVRLQAQAEHEGRGGRRDRPARHAQVDRERRAAGRGGARRPAGGRLEDHARHRPVRRRGDDPDAGRHRRRRHRGLGRRRGCVLRRPDARGAAAEPVAPARRQPDDRPQERPAAGAVADAHRPRRSSSRTARRSRSSSAPRTARSARSSSTRRRARRTLKQLRRSCS